MRHIVVDPDREMILRRNLGQLVEDALDHRGRELFGGEAIAAADDQGLGVGSWGWVSSIPNS